MRRPLRTAFWRVKERLAVPPATAVETETRLAWLAARTPRYSPGEFRFPFGRLRYVDALSLRYQYVDIFVQRGYDFRCSRADPTILDCGSNVGLSVIAFKRRYPKARITAFEADPTIADVLASNLSTAGAEDVIVVKAAAWVRPGTVKFTRDGADSGRVDAGGGQDVQAVRLADFVGERVDMLKLDIEGAEYAVIEDLCESRKIERVDRIVCEFHGRPADKSGFARVLTRLMDAGFTFSVGAARCAPDLAGPVDPTPFAFAHDGKFLAQLYAWRVGLECG
jgi:FkbM family methyltransferase